MISYWFAIDITRTILCWKLPKRVYFGDFYIIQEINELKWFSRKHHLLVTGELLPFFFSSVLQFFQFSLKERLTQTFVSLSMREHQSMQNNIYLENISDIGIGVKESNWIWESKKLGEWGKDKKLFGLKILWVFSSFFWRWNVLSAMLNMEWSEVGLIACPIIVFMIHIGFCLITEVLMPHSKLKLKSFTREAWVVEVLTLWNGRKRNVNFTTSDNLPVLLCTSFIHNLKKFVTSNRWIEGFPFQQVTP